MKTIQEIRKSFRDNYNRYAKDLNELNKLITELTKETDELLSFMETAMQIKEELNENKN